MTANRTPLRFFVNPSGIAVFGASSQPGTLGFGVAHNLLDGKFSNRVHLINPRHMQIGEHSCLASLDQVQGAVSLALIATPMATVPAIIEACGRRGITSAIVYSADQGDNTLQDTESLRLVQAAAVRAKVRLIGPRAMGFVLPHAGLNTTPVRKLVPKGNLGFVSHSNALCAGILDWSHNDEFGYSAVFCPGASIDLELPEILDYLTSDLHTETILLYLEGIRDARRFMSAVRAAASVKPVIAVKAGHLPGAARFAASHSGGATGDDDVLDAALRRAGVLRVHSIGDMFSAARALSNPCKPHGKRLAMVSNGSGPIVIAADSAAEHGIDLCALTTSTVQRLDALLPPTCSRDNPVDVLFDSGAERFVGALSACLDDPNVDGVLAVLSPNTFVDPRELAQATIVTAQQAKKPLLTCWLGDTEARPARAAFAQARIPSFRSPENAVAGYAFVVNWVRNQALLQETAPALSSYLEPDVAVASDTIARALGAGRSALSAAEVQVVLKAFHIPVFDPAQSVVFAPSAGLPCSSGLVQRDSADAQRSALRVAIRPDLVFGPVIVLSEGGAALDIYGIRSVALPPLNARLVNEMMDEPHLARLLASLGLGPAQARSPLRDVLLRVSEMASELACLHTLDIGLLRVDELGVSADDVRMEIRPASAGADRYRHMAICPYPAQFAQDWSLKDGNAISIRPIRPEDAAALQEFVRGLSSRSKYFRFFSMVNELPQRLLARYTQIDYARELTMVATITSTCEGNTVMLGEANYGILADGKTCEFALVVADDMAGKGLGAKLMRCLMEAAREQGLSVMQGEVMPDNEAMLALMEVLDFNIHHTDDGVLEVSRRL